jgi:hypothetical protein
VLILFSDFSWEKDGKLSKAACWLVFTGQYSKAADLLMRSDGNCLSISGGILN